MRMFAAQCLIEVAIYNVSENVATFKQPHCHCVAILAAPAVVK